MTSVTQTLMTNSNSHCAMRTRGKWRHLTDWISISGVDCIFQMCFNIYASVFLLENRRLQSWWRLAMKSAPCSRSIQVQRWSCPLRLAAKGVTKNLCEGTLACNKVQEITQNLTFVMLPKFSATENHTAAANW